MPAAITAAPIGYVEFPMAQHAFDVLANARANAAAIGALAFSDAVLGRTDRLLPIDASEEAYRAAA